MTDRPRLLPALICGLIAFTHFSVSAGPIYRCTHNGQNVRYQQQPCTEGEPAQALRLEDKRAPEQVKQAQVRLADTQAQAKRMARERIHDERQARQQTRYAGALTIAATGDKTHPSNKTLRRPQGQPASRDGLAFEPKERDFRAVHRPPRKKSQNQTPAFALAQQ